MASDRRFPTDATDANAIRRTSNQLNNDVVLLCSRFDNAVELLALWAEEYPNERLASMTRALLERVGATPAEDDQS